MTPLFVLIDGRSGAGKTSLAASLIREFDDAAVPAALVHVEDMYPGWDGLDAAIRTLSDELIPAWAHGRAAAWTPWDWSADAPAAERRSTEAAPVIVLEGVGASSASVLESVSRAGAQALTVWVSLDNEARKQRALARDGEAYAPHWDRWAAQEDAWLAGPNAPGAPDITVDGDGRAPLDTRSVGRLAPVLAAVLPDSALAPVLRAPWTSAGSGRLDVSDDASLRGLYEALTTDLPHGAWLDSSMDVAGPRNERIIMAAGRLGVDYTAGASGAVGRLAVTLDGVRATRAVPFFDWLSGAWPSPPAEELTGPELGELLQLGWIMQLGYELRAECGTPDIPAAGPLDRDARAFWPERLAVVDVASGSWQMLVRGPVCDTTGHPEAHPHEPLSRPVFASRDTRGQYLEMIDRCREEIRLGNSYEVCLTTTLTAPLPDSADTLEMFERLRRRSPAPFGAYLRMFGGEEQEFVLVGSSPERFLAVDAEGMATAEPIKGTRRRGATTEEDARLRTELAESPKDRAENIMIVDLLRNDLGATAVTGSVRVDRLCAIEEYATVFQMVSTIRAEVRPEVGRGELVRAAFPPGSMTGCPKISTMDILGRLEEERRGAYSGSLGYVCWDGSGDFAVVIRSIEIIRTDAGREMRLGLGGAITIESDPAAEWDEVRAKSAGVLGALGAAFPEAPPTD